MDRKVVEEAENVAAGSTPTHCPLCEEPGHDENTCPLQEELIHSWEEQAAAEAEADVPPSDTAPKAHICVLMFLLQHIICSVNPLQHD
jgi:hypothetical protein